MDYIYRGGVQFNLENWRKAFGRGYFLLLTAALEFWHQEPHDECVAGSTQIFTASWDWAHAGILDNGLIPTNAKDEDYVDTIPPFTPAPEGELTGMHNINVTPQVLKWIGGEPNFGFCFMGTDESMPDDGNSVCVNQFGLFKLVMTYLPFEGWDPDGIFPPDHLQVRRPRYVATSSTTVGVVPESLQRRLKEPRQR
jgi:hypothetical protein